MRLLYFPLILFISISLQTTGQTLHEVTMSGFSFVPENLTINEGDTVRWINTTGTFHTTTSGASCTMDGMWDADLNPGDSFMYIFNNSGDFPYFCIPHCGAGMTGNITVECNSVNAMATVDMHESCLGSCDGQATASGGTNYMWSDGQTTATATDLCPGTYDVTVSDGSGCSDVASVTIDPGIEINAMATVDMHESCLGSCDGQATASGGTNYMWSDGQTTATASNLCAGTYDVTVSDNNGCSDVTSVTIDPGNTIEATANVIQDESCVGLCDGQAVASGGTNYIWSDGQTTATATDLCPGTYSVTVSDANGCSDIASVIIDSGTSVIASATVDMHESCEGNCDGQATASGGTNYVWSDGQTTATATGLCAGTYDVTVSDMNGCTDIASVTINPGNTRTTPIFSFDTSLCLNDPPQSLPTTSDNGISGNWSGNGVMNNEFNPADAGIGNNVITFNPNPDECAMSITVTMVVENCNCQDPPSADAGNDQFTCGSSNVQLNGTIMNAPSASWSTSGSGGFNDSTSLTAIYMPSQADIDSGEIMLTLTTVDPDGSGPCTPDSDQLVLTFGFQPDIDNYSDVSECDEYVLPQIMGDASASAGYYDQVDGMGTQYAPGDTITQSMKMYVYDNQNGCTDQDSFEITINTITADAGMDQSIPFGTSAILSASANDGSGNYSYSWTPIEKVVDPTDPQTETTDLTETTDFTVEVTDNNTGCIDQDGVSITVTGGPLNVNISGGSEEICVGDSITLEAVASGGVGAYSYSWTADPANFTSTEAIVQVSPSENTLYIVEVEDEEGTMVTDSVEIIVNQLPEADAGEDQSYCAEDNGVEICASEINNGLYQWSDGNTTYSDRCAELSEGEWVLTVQDENGCENTDAVEVTQSEPIEVELSADSSVNIMGGTPPYDTTFAMNGDTLQVNVTDENGCMGSDEIVITSIISSALSDVNIYPNPVSDILMIETDNAFQYRAMLYNQFGKKLKEQENAKSIDISEYVPGIYYLHLSMVDGTERAVRRVPVVIVR